MSIGTPELPQIERKPLGTLWVEKNDNPNQNLEAVIPPVAAEALPDEDPEKYTHNSESWRLGLRNEEELDEINEFIETNTVVSGIMGANILIRLIPGLIITGAGVVMLFTPGPGIPMIALGLGVIIGSKPLIKKMLRGFFKFCDIISTQTVERYVRHGRFTRKPTPLNENGRPIRRTRQAFDWGA